MNLVVDIGNTSNKVALFDKKNIVKQETFLNLHLEELIRFSNKNQLSKTIISSVQKKSQNIESIARYFDALYCSHQMDVPISIKYKTPETLGTDRIAAIVGANNEFPNKNLLSIDAGSCITYDYFLEESYVGGRISPGLKMRFNALHQFTNQLPKINTRDSFPNIGNDTSSSIIAGVQGSAVDEMEAVISDFRKENNNTIVILTGGDCGFFEKHLKNSIFADPLIVLKGLNIILEFNAK